MITGIRGEGITATLAELEANELLAGPLIADYLHQALGADYKITAWYFPPSLQSLYSGLFPAAQGSQVFAHMIYDGDTPDENPADPEHLIIRQRWIVAYNATHYRTPGESLTHLQTLGALMTATARALMGYMPFTDASGRRSPAVTTRVLSALPPFHDQGNADAYYPLPFELTFTREEDHDG